MGYDLEGKGKADEGTGETGKETVVVAFASSETVAHQGEGHARDEREVDAGIVGEEGTGGLLNAVGGACGEGGFALVDVEGEVFA